MTPTPLLLALTLVTAFVAVLRSVPVAEDVVSRPPVMTPAAAWPMLVEAVRLTALLPALIPPVRLSPPPLLVAPTGPPAVLSLIPVTMSVLVESTSLTTPTPVLLALKLVTSLVAVLRSVPVAEEVVSRPPVMTPAAVWPMLVEAVMLTALLPALAAPVKLRAPPLLVNVTGPPAVVSLSPVTDSVATESFSLTTPTPVFVAFKLVTSLVAALRSVPVAEEVVSRPPVMTPAAV